MGVAFLSVAAVTHVPAPDTLWAVAVILRGAGNGGGDELWRWQIRPNMGRANPTVLADTGYHDRFKVPPGDETLAWGPSTVEPDRARYSEAATFMERILHGRTLVADAPAVEHLAVFLRGHGTGPSWAPPVVDALSYAAGWAHGNPAVAGTVPGLPWDRAVVAAAVGVPLPPEPRTVTATAEWVRDVYDAVTRHAPAVTGP